MEKKKTTKYTAEGYQALVDELNYLKGEKTEEVKNSLAFARSLGDLSENSEYDAAKDEQGQVAARISELEELIKIAEIIDENELDENVANLGSTIRLFDEEFVRASTDGFEALGSGIRDRVDQRSGSHVRQDLRPVSHRGRDDRKDRGRRGSGGDPRRRSEIQSAQSRAHEERGLRGINRGRKKETWLRTTGRRRLLCRRKNT